MDEDMFRPPVNRALRTLDKTLFRKECLISAAKVQDIRNTSSIRQTLVKSRDIFSRKQLLPIRDIVDGGAKLGAKCILLNPEIQANAPDTWSPTINALVDEGKVTLVPHELVLTFDHWTTSELLKSILPEDLHDEIPTHYNHAGHIAHLNLRERYLPYKSIIGNVILSKSPSIRTVINKTETLGSENEFRVIDYELLAGTDDLKTEAREAGSVFRFDYSKVFWNSRLSTEHERLAQIFKPGEVVCDAMAGVGPFAIPAARNGVFVWANDLNPDCFESLEDAIKLNKVSGFVRSFNEDAHSFIRTSAKRLLDSNHIAKVPIKISRSEATARGLKPSELFTQVTAPRIFSHYVMNLPSTAIDFLPDFIGLYAAHEELFAGPNAHKLPLVHCYCFGAKADSGSQEDMEVKKEVCAQISEKLRSSVLIEDEDTTIYDVRDVAPNKRQLCATFRLPAEAAFRNA